MHVGWNWTVGNDWAELIDAKLLFLLQLHPGLNVTQKHVHGTCRTKVHFFHGQKICFWKKEKRAIETKKEALNNNDDEKKRKKKQVRKACTQKVNAILL